MVLTVCGHCFSEDPDREVDYATDILQGNLVLQDGSVYLRRHCRRGHGEVVSLYDEDHDLWEYLQQWRVPTREIVEDTPDNVMPIPMGYANGLGRLQTQHSCILLMDVTEHCNLNCPTCFAASGTNVGRYARLPHILRTLDASIEREGGKIDVLMLSGGEPTVHPEIVEIIQAAVERKVTRVLLNTNGIRDRDATTASSPRFSDLRDRVEVYLQFDGFELETHLYHRGEDLREMKARGDPAADRCAHLHDAHHGRGPGRQRPRDRRGGRLRVRHRLHRRRGLPAGLRLRSRQPDRPDEPHDDHRRPQAPRAADRADGRPPRTSSRCRAAIPTAARSPTSCARTPGRIGPSRSWSGSSG